uniref:Natural cytotoxicity triggering receptor 3 n=1 Tax=Xenopus tropicalis TaxID=8364 RepID=A0A803J2F9_XENTR
NLTVILIVYCSLSQNIEVSQIPEVNAIEGSTANLECSYNSNNLNLPNVTFGWYTWYTHMLGGPEVANDSDHFTGRVSSACQSEFINNRSASIQLHRVQISDTGMYICEVALGLNKTLQGHGNGTFLYVAGIFLIHKKIKTFALIYFVAYSTGVRVPFQRTICSAGAYLGYHTI